MSVLGADDHDFLRENGYVVVHNAVPQEYLDSAVNAIWEFLGVDSTDPSDWYRPPLRRDGLVELYQHQAFWDNRQHPRVHQAFTELYGVEELMVSIDRASLKLPDHPRHPDYRHTGFIHWDADPTKPRPLALQGVLCLTDTAADQGGFQCVPALYRDFATRTTSRPAAGDPRRPDLTGHTITHVAGRAGDLIIWDAKLAHGNGHNTSDTPRLAQYITMNPARYDNPDWLEHRIRCWAKHSPPGTTVFPGDARRTEEDSGTTAHLTPLGRKLLGLDRWQ